MTKPVEVPKNRPSEKLSFDDSNIIMMDIQGGYMEFCFEELRLKDYRAKKFDQQLINFETGFKQTNPLDRSKIAARVVNSPTINTRYALDQLEAVLKGQVNTKQSLITENNFEPTVNFDALKLSLIDVQRRNEERGINPDDM